MSGAMSEARLAEIEARERAATPGPWWGCRDACHPANYTPESVVFAADWSTVCELATDDGLGDRDRANKDFNAHARQDVPELTTEVRRLRGELAAVIDRRCETCGRWDGSLAHPPHLRSKGECVLVSDDDGESAYIYGLPRFTDADKPGCSSWIPREVTL